MLAPQHHPDSAAVCSGDVDDVGDLAGPVDEAAIDVNAQVVELQTLSGSGQRARHHRHTLRAEILQVRGQQQKTVLILALDRNNRPGSRPPELVG